MKISYDQKLAIAAGVAIIGVFFFGLFSKSGFSSTSLAVPGGAPTSPAANLSGQRETNSVSPQLVVAPFIVEDTQNDSPGTNIVTRIVTFSAEIGGIPPPVLQWKVDKGAGFVDVAGATKTTFRIGNAQVLDCGFYSLFATNSAGSIHTTPQQLVVTEGED